MSWNRAARRSVRSRGCLVDDGKGVGQHVLVPVLGVLLHREVRELGEEVGSQARPYDPLQRGSRHRGDQQLGQLVPDPLCGDDLEAVPHRRNRCQCLRIGVEPECRLETEQAEHAQRVVREGESGLDRRPQSLRSQVGQTAEGVDWLHLHEAKRHCVHGEVATRQVVFDPLRVAHLWLARVVSVHVGAKGGDLDRLAVFHRGHGPECRTDRVNRIRPIPEDRSGPVGKGIGGEVEVEFVDLPLQEGVAHRSPNQEQLMAGRREPIGQLCRRQFGGDQELESLRDHPVRLRGSTSRSSLKSCIRVL